MTDSKTAQSGKAAPQDESAGTVAQRLEKARAVLQTQGAAQPDAPSISRWSSWYNR